MHKIFSREKHTGSNRNRGNKGFIYLVNLNKYRKKLFS